MVKGGAGVRLPGIEPGHYPVSRRHGEAADGPLTVDHQPHGHALHPARREAGLHFFPQHRAQLEAHQPVEHPPRLLGIYQVEVDFARVLNGLENGGFGDFAEHDAPRFVAVQVQRFGQVPADGLALPVIVTGQPHNFGLLGQLLQLADYLALIGRYDVGGLEAVGNIDGVVVFGQVADVAERRAHHEVFAEVALDGFGLGG